MYEDSFHHPQTASDRILNLKHMAAMHLREKDWQHLGEVTGCADLIRQHERLGALHWGDNGYDACVLQVLTAVVAHCPEALQVMEEYVHNICQGAEAENFAEATLVRLS